MLAIADANVRDHPEDKSLANMSCFARGRYGFDVENAMPYCNVAVDGTGRQGWTLVNRGRVELALGLYKEALADFNEALGNKEMTERIVAQAAEVYLLAPDAFAAMIDKEHAFWSGVVKKLNLQME